MPTRIYNVYDSTHSYLALTEDTLYFVESDNLRDADHFHALLEHGSLPHVAVPLDTIERLEHTADSTTTTLYQRGDDEGNVLMFADKTKGREFLSSLPARLEMRRTEEERSTMSVLTTFVPLLAFIGAMLAAAVIYDEQDVMELSRGGGRKARQATGLIKMAYHYLGQTVIIGILALLLAASAYYFVRSLRVRDIDVVYQR